MRKFIAAFIFFLFATGIINAQDSCRCITNLDSMIKKVSNNYAGYKDKVNAQTQLFYQTLVDSLRREALNKKNMGDCFPLLEKYRLYFYDKHLQLRLNTAQTQADTANVSANAQPPQTKFTKHSVTSYLQKQKSTLNAIEGVWTTEGYEIGIQYNAVNKTYDAIVFSSANKNWKEGMLKFRSKPASHGIYQTEYYRGDFIKNNVRINADKNILEVENFALWRKTFPLNKDTISTKQYQSVFGYFQLKYLNASTVYIALRSCDLSLKPIVDSTLLSNKEKLKTIPDWIVDFRGNEGGVTDVFLGLLPYLYTKPLLQKGSSQWLTPDNIGELKKFMEENKALLDTSTLNQIYKWIAFANKNPNGWYHDAPDTVKFDSVMGYPKRVAVLSDKNNASSGETFLIVARGLSDKVTIMGENSAGYLDYGNLVPSYLPCNQLALYIPSRRANYVDDGISYDRTGYPPDVYIPKGNKDWIQFIYDYWKQHPQQASHSEVKNIKQKKN